MSSAETLVGLPDMPYNVTPVVLGASNGDDPRLVVFNYYLYAEGIYKGNEAWVTGARVDELLDGGQLTEILSKNSKHLVGHMTPNVEPPAAVAAPEPVAEPAPPVADPVVTVDDDDDDVGGSLFVGD